MAKQKTEVKCTLEGHFSRLKIVLHYLEGFADAMESKSLQQKVESWRQTTNLEREQLTQYIRELEERCGESS